MPCIRIRFQSSVSLVIESIPARAATRIISTIADVIEGKVCPVPRILETPGRQPESLDCVVKVSPFALYGLVAIAASPKMAMEILTSSDDNTSRVCDAESRKELFTLSGHTQTINRAIWDADETRILTASGDGTARQWYVRMEGLLAAACQQTLRNMTTEEWQQFVGDEPYQPTCPNLPSSS